MYMLPELKYHCGTVTAWLQPARVASYSDDTLYCKVVCSILGDCNFVYSILSYLGSLVILPDGTDRNCSPTFHCLDIIFSSALS